MKTLFIGGIKSGKSRLAEAYILNNAQTKPYYLATTEFIDEEMREPVAVEQAQVEQADLAARGEIMLSDGKSEDELIY